MLSRSTELKKNTEQNISPITFLLTIGSFVNSFPDKISTLSQNETVITAIQKNLSEISTEQLLKICENDQAFQTFLITVVFLQREDKLYRANTGRKQIQATWSDKLMSLVGSLQGGEILTGVLNHLGDPVRTKKDSHNKAAEAAEIREIHLRFLEESLTFLKDELLDFNLPVAVSHVMAEVADGIYNLTQLISLDEDQKSQALYDKYLKQLGAIFNVSRADLLQLSIAKYHHRMYTSKDGVNQYDSEDELILVVLRAKFPHLIENINVSRTILNNSYLHFDTIFAKLHDIMIEKFLRIYKTLNPENQTIMNAIFRSNFRKTIDFLKSIGLSDELILQIFANTLASNQT